MSNSGKGALFLILLETAASALGAEPSLLRLRWRLRRPGEGPPPAPGPPGLREALCNLGAVY